MYVLRYLVVPLLFLKREALQVLLRFLLRQLQLQRPPPPLAPVEHRQPSRLPLCVPRDWQTTTLSGVCVRSSPVIGFPAANSMVCHIMGDFRWGAVSRQNKVATAVFEIRGDDEARWTPCCKKRVESAPAVKKNSYCFVCKSPL